ncbi:ATP-binding protein [Rhizobiales bacterium Sp-1]|uniref:ATP-binding protein n=1 Tax=Segnochrobactrum spirostomi TaxID=2608987 RepID=A0A6A7Y4A8_9HYPH|nr:ATP-binding protein [Segnochrobactrum spirostomi]MQT13058.1 ATP-binding protein [Segnochrobactrum spirostomi]
MSGPTRRTNRHFISLSPKNHIGGGLRARPGEVSLAHHGVLFLDELPEFHPQVLDALRQPLENREAVIARANHRVAYPASIQLVAAMNPCRCGLAGEPGHTCRRGPRCAADYQARLSGPFLDRVDLRIEVPAVSAADLTLPPPAEGSAEVAARVAAARARQTARFEALGVPARLNAECGPNLIETVAESDAAGRALIAGAAESLRLSARGYHRVLKVARTLADLDGEDRVGRHHLAEALALRSAGPSLAAVAA